MTLRFPSLNVVALVKDSSFAPWNQKPRQQSYMMVVATAVFVAAMGFFSLKPQVENLFQLNNQLQEVNEKIKATQERVGDLVSLKTKLDQSQEELSLLNAALPLSAQPHQLTQLIEDVVIQHGAQISALQMGTMKLEPIIVTDKTIQLYKAEVPFSLGLSGDFVGLKQFLTSFEQSSRIILIDQVAFDAKSSGLEATIKARAFFITDAAPIDKNAPPAAREEDVGAKTKK